MKENKFIYTLPIRCIFFIMAFFSISICTKSSLLEVSKWWTLIMIICNIITIFILLHICRNKNITYKELVNYRKEDYNTKNVLLWTLLIVIAGVVGMYFTGLIVYKEIPYTPEVIMQPVPIILAVLNVVILPLSTTIAEEGLYLGIGLNKEKNKFFIIIPAFFYILQHSFLPMIWDWKYILYRFFSFVPVILLMCIYYNKQRKILPIMIGHFLINFITVLEILRISI